MTVVEEQPEERRPCGCWSAFLRLFRRKKKARKTGAKNTVSVRYVNEDERQQLREQLQNEQQAGAEENVQEKRDELQETATVEEEEHVDDLVKEEKHIEDGIVKEEEEELVEDDGVKEEHVEDEIEKEEHFEDEIVKEEEAEQNETIQCSAGGPREGSRSSWSSLGVSGAITRLTGGWLASLALVTTLPILLVFGTVLPILTETVPFLAAKCPLPFDVTAGLQLVFLLLLAELALDYYKIQLGLGGGSASYKENWCHECWKRVARNSFHCKVCNECIDDYKCHSVLFSVCIGRTNLKQCQSVVTRLIAASVGGLVLLVLEAAMGQEQRTSSMILFVCAAIALEHVLADMKRTPARRTL